MIIAWNDSKQFYYCETIKEAQEYVDKGWATTILVDNSKPEPKRFYLLLYDSHIQDWYFHGVFDTLEICEDIGRRSEGYQIIKGNIIKRAMFDDDR